MTKQKNDFDVESPSASFWKQTPRNSESCREEGAGSASGIWVRESPLGRGAAPGPSLVSVHLANEESFLRVLNDLGGKQKEDYFMTCEMI